MTARVRTKFESCDRHAWLSGESRQRRAEFYVEGGPADQSGCTGGKCRLWPGTDLFEPSVCTSEFPLDWTEAEGEER